MQKLKLKSKIFFLAILVCGIFGAGVKGVSAATYYVDIAGTNNSTCGTASGSEACATLSYIIETRHLGSAGDNIQIAAGDYTDNTAIVLPVGVNIHGADSETTSITTNQLKYISLQSSVPTVDGSNEISGLAFYGTGANDCIDSSGRNNQKIYDCYFQDFDKAISVQGKTPITSWNEGDCTGPATETAYFCANYKPWSNEPGSTDWATGIEIYENTLKDAKIYAHTIKGAKIHDNVIDNTASLKSGVGHTALWWSGVEFYNNTINTQTIAWSTIALEVWMTEGDSKFYNNTTNGWFSILGNPNGENEPYLYRIYGNTFSSDVVPGVGSALVGAALESCFYSENVLIADNYFENTGAQATYTIGVGIWGRGVNKNYIIKNNSTLNIGVAVNIESSENPEVPFDGDDFYIYNNTFEGGAFGKGIIWIGNNAGDIDNVIIKNNIFMNSGSKPWYYGAYIYPEGHSVSGCSFANNIVYGGDGFVYDYGPNNGFSGGVSNNYTWNPDLEKSGGRPDPFYQPASAGANVVDAGTANIAPEIELTGYAGLAPDVGAYEYIPSGDTISPASPSGLSVD